MSPHTRTAALLGLGALTIVAMLLWRPSADRGGSGSREAGRSEQATPRLPGRSDASQTPELHELGLLLRSRTGLPNESSYLLTVSRGAEDAICVVSLDAGRVSATLKANELGLHIDCNRTSNEEIRMVLAGVPAGRYRATARRLDPGEPALLSQSVAFSVPCPDEAVLVDLGVRHGEGRLTVSLTSEDPLRRARVNVRLQESGEYVLTRDIEAPRSGPETTIQGTIVVPSQQMLRVAITSYDPGWSVLGLPPAQTVLVGPNGVETLAFDAPTGVVVTFSTRDRNDEALPFSLSVWRDEEHVGPRLVPLSGTVTITGATWRARLRPGRYFALATPNFSAPSAWRMFSVEEEALHVVFTADDQGTRARLRILDPDGQPQPGVRLNLNRDAEQLQDSVALPTRTSEEGRLVTPPLPAGRYLLVLWDLGLARWIDHVDEQERVLRVPRVSRGDGRVEGLVVDGAGTPQPAVRVYLEAPDGWSRVAPATDSAGRFEFEEVAPGSYRAYVRRSWFVKNPGLGGEARVDVVGGTHTQVELVVTAH